MVFSSHRHFDHYDPIIMTWEKAVPRLTYVFGFQAFTEPRHHYALGDKEVRVIDGMEVANVRDGTGGEAGVAFLVEVDGLALYHGDDYKGRRPPEPESLEWLASRQDRVGVAFLRLDEISARGSTFALEHLGAAAAFPMHAAEHLYPQQARQSAKAAPRTAFVCAMNRGDQYRYRARRLVTIGPQP